MLTEARMIIILQYINVSTDCTSKTYTMLYVNCISIKKKKLPGEKYTCFEFSRTMKMGAWMAQLVKHRTLAQVMIS